MSIVNSQTLAYIKDKRQKAYEASPWETKYNHAIRGLEAAIALLEQIDYTTQGLTIETKITLKKD